MLITKLTASFRFIQIRMTLTGHACVTPISYCQHDIHYYLELTNKLIIFTVFDPQTSFVIVRTTVERLILACPTIHKDPSGNTPGKSGYPALSVRAVFMGPYFMLWGTAALQWSAMGQALTFLCEHWFVAYSTLSYNRSLNAQWSVPKGAKREVEAAVRRSPLSDSSLNVLYQNSVFHHWLNQTVYSLHSFPLTTPPSPSNSPTGLIPRPASAPGLLSFHPLSADHFGHLFTGI